MVVVGVKAKIDKGRYCTVVFDLPVGKVRASTINQAFARMLDETLILIGNKNEGLKIALIERMLPIICNHAGLNNPERTAKRLIKEMRENYDGRELHKDSK